MDRGRYRVRSPHAERAGDMSILGPYELTELVRGELRYFKDHNEDNVGDLQDSPEDDPDSYTEAARVLGLVLDGKPLTEQERVVFCDELNCRDYVTEDNPKLLRDWLDLQVQAGDLEEFNPAVTYSRRPRTKIIRGKRYIIG